MFVLTYYLSVCLVLSGTYFYAAASPVHRHLKSSVPDRQRHTYGRKPQTTADERGRVVSYSERCVSYNGFWRQADRRVFLRRRLAGL